MPHPKKITSNTPWMRFRAANDLRDTIVDVSLGQSTLRNRVHTFKVKGRDLKCAAKGIKEQEGANKYELQYSHKYRDLYRLASDNTGAKCKEESAYTEYEQSSL